MLTLFRSVKFRMVVFRPHIGEILVGQILSTTDKGLKIGLKGWFEDIIVPAHLLQPGTRFDKASNCFIWDNEDVEPLAYDKGLKVRIRVQQERFVDVGPVKKTDKSKNSGMFVFLHLLFGVILAKKLVQEARRKFRI